MIRLNDFPVNLYIPVAYNTTIKVPRYALDFDQNYVVIPAQYAGAWTKYNDIYIKDSFGYMKFTTKQIVRLLSGKPLSYKVHGENVNLYFNATGQYDQHEHDARGKLFLDFDGSYAQKMNQQKSLQEQWEDAMLEERVAKATKIEPAKIDIADSDLPF